MATSENKEKLLFNVRLLIGVFAIPSLYLAYMVGIVVGIMVVNGDY